MFGFRFKRHKHLRVLFHSFKTYVPDTSMAVGTCLDCGRQVEVRLGFVAAKTQERLVEIANDTLTAKGWRPEDPERHARNVWIKETA